MRLFSLLALCLFSALPATAQDAGVLRLVTEDLWPYAYYEKGDLKGVSVELVQTIEKRLGIAAPIIVEPWARGLREASGDGNVALFTTAKTSEREPLFQWVGPIATSRTSFFRHRDSSVEVPSMNAVKDKRVVVSRGYPEQAMLEKSGFTHIYDCNDRATAWRLLAAGRGDLSVSGEVSACRSWTEAGFSTDEFERVGPPLFQSELYIVFSRAAPAAEVGAWRSAWESIKTDGTWAKILRRERLSSLFPD